MSKFKTKFQVGDVINSSISTAKRVMEIRLGREEDFKGKICNWTGQPCYVLQFLRGNKNETVYAVEAVDKDHHKKGSDMFKFYEDGWNQFFKEAEEQAYGGYH